MLTTEYRSLDMLCFSNQYYFLVCFLAVNMSLISIGLVIMIKARYNFFNDPSNFFYIAVIFPLFQILYWIFSRLGSLLNLWRKPRESPIKSFASSLKLENYLTQSLDIFEGENCFIINYLLIY